MFTPGKKVRISADPINVYDWLNKEIGPLYDYHSIRKGKWEWVFRYKDDASSELIRYVMFCTSVSDETIMLFTLRFA